MNKLALTTILATIALLFAATGCGGGSDDSGGAGGNGGGNSSTEASASTPSKPQFVKEADAICARGKKGVEAEFASFLEKNGIKAIGEKGESPSETEAHEAEVIETIGIPALRKQVGELRELGAPFGEEVRVAEYFEAIEEGIAEGEQDPQLLYSSPRKVFAKADKLAQELGFKVCGNR